MGKFKEIISKNSPYSYESFSTIIISKISYQSQLNTEKKESVYADSNIKRIFNSNASIWLKNSQEGEYQFNISTSLNDLVIHFLSRAAEVCQIYLLKESENIFHIWSVVPKKTDAVKRSIYKQEKGLIHYFKESVYFDFHIDVLSDIEYLKSSGALLIYERE